MRNARLWVRFPGSISGQRWRTDFSDFMRFCEVLCFRSFLHHELWRSRKHCDSLLTISGLEWGKVADEPHDVTRRIDYRLMEVWPTYSVQPIRRVHTTYYILFTIVIANAIILPHHRLSRSSIYRFSFAVALSERKSSSLHLCTPYMVSSTHSDWIMM